MSERLDLLQPNEESDTATIGIVEAVSSNSIEVEIVPEAPRGSGLHSGVLQQFPRINSFIVIPTGASSLLAVVVWVGIDVARTSERHRSSDQISLPAPRRRLRAVPLGQLKSASPEASSRDTAMRLERGANQFPIVGDPVRLPTPMEIAAALPRSTDTDLTIPIGRATRMENAGVRVRPDRLFGRHLAVLGSTGSGKSCSLAHLLRASALAVPEISGFNAVVLDMSGEYRHVFDGLPPTVAVRHFVVEPTDSDSSQFRVPYWLWNYREWLSFTQASSGVQAPQLRRCLEDLRSEDTASTGRASRTGASEDLPGCNLPIPFRDAQLLHQLDQAAEAPNGGGYLRTLAERLRIGMADSRQASISGWRDDESLKQWLQTYVPAGKGNQITVIDLSLVPSEVLDIVVAVFARVLIEAMQRFHRLAEGQVPPRMLVVEEAHTLMDRGTASSSGNLWEPPSQLCRETFERIAREGRKFGLSLVVSSQRPSELSGTVLSQCNTFVIHRIANEHDQSAVRRLMPDSFANLADELPSLPTQTALLLGWALDIPTVVRIRDLPVEYRPLSSDPEFEATWRGERDPALGWADVARDWVGTPKLSTDSPSLSTEPEPF